MSLICVWSESFMTIHYTQHETLIFPRVRAPEGTFNPFAKPPILPIMMRLPWGAGIAG